MYRGSHAAFFGIGFILVVFAFLAWKSIAEVRPEELTRLGNALPRDPVAVPATPRKLLVFTKTADERHVSIPTAVRAITQMGERTGAFAVVHSEDESVFEREQLAEFDGVLLLNVTGEIFRPETMPRDPATREKVLQREARLQRSLLDFVESGRGIAGIHAAAEACPSWGEYGKLMGSTSRGRPWTDEVSIKNLAPSHPVNAPLEGSSLKVRDEIPQFHESTVSSEERYVLLSLDGESANLTRGIRGDGLHPVSWVSRYGQGRTFYCALGHRAETYWNPDVLKHYLAGIQFVLGDLSADAWVVK